MGIIGGAKEWHPGLTFESPMIPVVQIAFATVGKIGKGSRTVFGILFILTMKRKNKLRDSRGSLPVIASR
jgi:hypothetical protein